VSSVRVTIASKPTCPRCGYDLSGTTDTWETQCAVEGVCSECGLGFEWREVFHPLRDVPKWLFEHPRCGVVHSLVVTLLRVLLPNLFWSDVKLSVPIRPGRMSVLVFVGTSIMWLMGLVNSIAVVVLEWGGASLSDVLTYVAQNLSWLAANNFASYFVVPVALFLVIAPLTFAVLGDTLRGAKVRPAHVVRVFAYITAGAMLLGGLALPIILLSYLQPDSLAPIVWLGVMWIWTLWSYWMSCRLYLRIPHAAAVAFAAVLISTLATAIILIGLGALLG
jgi:hypothetical protein